ncbi:MAG: hypothetical protein RSD13_04055 [Clostridium sp.]
MDQELVLKLLGKKDSVDIGDQVYNLIEITEYLSRLITLKLPIDEEIINSISRQLRDIHTIILEIKKNFADGENVIGYTNSKMYLSDFINALDVNTKGLIDSLQPFNNKYFIYYTNIITDLVLDY